MNLHGLVELSQNSLSGTLMPQSSWMLTNLKYHDLEWKALSGRHTFVSWGQLEFWHSTLPSEVGLLTLLSTFSFEMNNLSGSLPSEIGLLTLLKYLSASNSLLTDRLPSEMGHLCLTSPPFTFPTIPIRVVSGRDLACYLSRYIQYQHLGFNKRHDLLNNLKWTSWNKTIYHSVLSPNWCLFCSSSCDAAT